MIQRTPDQAHLVLVMHRFLTYQWRGDFAAGQRTVAPGSFTGMSIGTFATGQEWR